MSVEFTAHNIRLDDGTCTKPEVGYSMEEYRWFVSARRVIETVFPGDKKSLRLADLGCLEGGFSVEFARMGFQVLGFDVRETNITACNFVKSRTNLPHLTFVKDDAFNIGKYGVFDVVFCCGLLYHLERPKQLLDAISEATTRLLILQTHFSTDTIYARSRLQKLVRKLFPKVYNRPTDKFRLSKISENEKLAGRWYQEFPDEKSFRQRENRKWASWDNRRSFWIQREHLLQAIQDVGFDLVMEQFDPLGTNIVDSMLHGYYRTDRRGTFIGMKTGIAGGKP